ncbi:MAG: fibronectin type III domain-containing protein [Candidatus Hinthialibacter antarcticus]|nr:fibronectin type III domain-containing protein [Candidatus Hinthialibacter antarcticus]
MLRMIVLFITCIVLLPMTARTEPITSSVIVPEWVAPNFELKCSETPTCENAIFTIFYREQNNETASAWQTISLASAANTRAVPFSGKDGQRFQFRSAVTCDHESDHVALCSFDKFSDMTKALLMSSAPGILLSQSFGVDAPIEGRACGTFEFEWREESMKQRDIDLIGVGFTKEMTTLDWSNYRYLDFYYWSDAPKGFSVRIAAASDEFQAELDTLSRTGDERSQWHYCVIDLDEAFTSPEKRRSIERFAITTPSNSLKLNTKYKLLLDGVHLWRNRNISETRIDSTPPSDPSNLVGEHQSNKMSWSWDSAVDEQSDIEGYSYIWTTHGLHQPPEEVLTKEPKITFAFQPPAFYTSYYMKVRARNRAGLWSDVIETTMDFLPRQDDPTPAPRPTPTPKPED